MEEIKETVYMAQDLALRSIRNRGQDKQNFGWVTKGRLWNIIVVISQTAKATNDNTTQQAQGRMQPRTPQGTASSGTMTPITVRERTCRAVKTLQWVDMLQQ